MLLGGMRAEERIAAFLLNLARRLKARSYSGRTMVLRMTREGIGNYLGMTIETVSRTLSRLQADGYVRLDKREVETLDADRLAPMLQR